MYKFTVNWFDQSENPWSVLIRDFKPKNMLEIGSFEGKSACYAIEKATEYNPIVLHCVDTWQGSVEHVGMEQLNELEETFNSNIKHALSKASNAVKFEKYKGKSQDVLPYMITRRHMYDWIYIDGSHMAPDVLVDACMSFQLLEVGGLMIFDDYRLTEVRQETEALEKMNHARPAVDSFLFVFKNKMRPVRLYNMKDEVIENTYQCYVQKISD